MKANLNLTRYGPEDFNVKVGTLRPSCRINRKGKFAFPLEAINLLKIKRGDHLRLHQHNDYPGNWLHEIGNKGWKIIGHQHASSSLGFNCRFLKDEICNCFDLDENLTGFSMLIHDEPVEHEGGKLWIMYYDESHLEEFLQSISATTKVRKII
jgi:hypothetical protein